MRLPWQRKPIRVSPHKHYKDQWAGDVWDFADPDESPSMGGHYSKWRCRCGVVLREDRDFNEFPHITVSA